jgi:hypothetical protein
VVSQDLRWLKSFQVSAPGAGQALGDSKEVSMLNVLVFTASGWAMRMQWFQEQARRFFDTLKQAPGSSAVFGAGG